MLRFQGGCANPWNKYLQQESSKIPLNTTWRYLPTNQEIHNGNNHKYTSD